MFQNVAPINKERHAKTKIKQSSDFHFAKEFHLAYVTVHEFVRASGNYPIVFLEDKQTEGFKAIALLGMEAGRNAFINDSGKWDAPYIPAIIRRYPFALAPSAEGDRFIVCVDEGSDLVNEDDGASLFNAEGEAEPIIDNVKRYLAELHQMDQFTAEFAAFLQANNLLTPLSMRVSLNEQPRNITGCYVVNEDRLNNLSDAKFLEIREKKYLPAIYAHLMSLAQFESLAKRSVSSGGSDIEVKDAAEEVVDDVDDAQGGAEKTKGTPAKKRLM